MVKAFPTAIGAGQNTTGGRGGTVLHVTNLNDSGAGSFREALTQTFPRIIVFDVSGVINLTSVLYINSANNDVTILGQTAPEGGITLDGDRVYIAFADNIICRYIRFKGGIDVANDSLTVAEGASNQIFDHCSFAFGGDEAASWYTTNPNALCENITIQRCLFGEVSKASIVGVSADDLALPAPTNPVTATFAYNLMYNAGYRFPNVSGRQGRFDVINNVSWRVSSRLIRGNGDYNLNHIGNYYNYTDFGITDLRINLHAFGYVPQIHTVNNKIVYQSANSPLTNTDVEMNANNKLSWKFFQDGGGFLYGDQLPTNYFTDTQHAILGDPYEVLTADEAYIQIPQNVGCNARLNSDGTISNNLDVHDTQYISNVQNGVFAPREIGNYNVSPITSVSRPVGYYSTSSDIPEDWFVTNVSNGATATDLSPSGYTWIEEFANQVDTPVVKTFPKAIGAAAYIDTFQQTTPTVVHVTSLADGTRDDVGTLRWAIQNVALKSVNRIVVFDISGVINLSSEIYASNGAGDEGGYTGSIYFAGQTAPLGGITISGNRIRLVQWNTIIVRYLKFRNDGTYDGSISVRAYNEIIDHCSVSHASNATAISVAAMQEGDLTNATFSNNLMGQCSYAVIMGETTPNAARSLEGGNYTVAKNAYYNCGWRVPFKGGSGLRMDAVNNLVHNWSERLIRMDGHAYKLNHFQNYYQAGGNTSKQLLWSSYLNAVNVPQIYTNDNFLEDDPRGNYVKPIGFDTDESVAWTEFQNNFVALPSNYFVPTQHPVHNAETYTILDNSNLKTELLPLVGASQYIKDDGTVGVYRDDYDTEFVNGININDASTRNSTLALPINSLSNTRPVNFYQSSSNIPEAWFSVNVPSGQTESDLAPSGYTWLEEYINQVDTTPIKAFPKAVGAGAYTTGGRGGTVIHVTSLADSGAGTLREALTTSGTRIIVFDVSGVIQLQSDINTAFGNFTVAGQTAPEGGITIIGTGDIRIDADNHIWRYIRLRNGYDTANVDGGFTNTTSGINTRNGTNFIIDHCSSALAKETSGLGGGQVERVIVPELTSQNNLIVECARGMIVGDSNDSDATIVTVYRNGWINSGWRFPKAGGEIDLDVINCYVSNWEGRTIRMDPYDYKLNLINNVYEAGNLTRLTDNPEILFTTWTNNVMNPQIWDEGTLIIPYIYDGGASTYDPTPIGYPADISLAWDPFFTSTEPINPAWFANSRLPLASPVDSILSSNNVKDSILENSGANKYFDNTGTPQTYRDPLDEGAINIAKGLGNSYVINGIIYDLSDGTKLLESDYETIALGLVNDTPSNTRPVEFYSSNPHIPELWFSANVPSGQTENDIAPNGYTWIENYLNQVDGVVITPPPANENIYYNISEQTRARGRKYLTKFIKL